MLNPSTGKFIEGTRVAIPYIKGLSEKYRHTLAKYKVRDFFKGNNTIKSLLMKPKDPIPDAQITDIIYHWKCPVHNCRAEHTSRTGTHPSLFVSHMKHNKNCYVHIAQFIHACHIRVSMYLWPNLALQLQYMPVQPRCMPCMPY